MFGHCFDKDNHYQDRLVRMKDGSVSSINTSIHNDPDVRAIYDHFSVSETKQAIGRGRLIYGKSKDIYYLSNESIGTDIEITGFIYKEDIFYNPLITDENWGKLIKTGFIRDNQPDLIQYLNLSKNILRINRKNLEFDLIEKGFGYYSVSFTDKNRNLRNWAYFVKDQEKLKIYLVAKDIINPKIESKVL